jgi:cytochrome bd-type quinol oxidase subunit 2
MKTFGLAVLAATGGYLIGLLGGMFLIEASSSNQHDKSVEAAMTGAFVSGPLMAAVAVIVTLIFRFRHSSNR